MKQPKVLDVIPHTPTAKTREDVEILTGIGLSVDEVAYVLRATPAEVKACYPDELKYGAAKSTATVGKTVYNRAVRGDIKAATLYLKARSGWRDQQTPASQQPDPTETTKSALIDRILAMLTPAQVVEALKADGGPPKVTPAVLSQSKH